MNIHKRTRLTLLDRQEIWRLYQTRVWKVTQLADRIQPFVDYYNHERYYESLNNLTPADVFYDRVQSILDERKK